MADRDTALAAREERLDEYITQVTLAAPTAGNQWAQPTVPGGEIWRLLALTFTMTTSSTAGTRNPYLQISSNSIVLGYWYAGAGQGLSVANCSYTFADVSAQGGAIVSNGGITTPIPTIPLFPGYNIAPLVSNLKANDSLSALTYTYEILSEGQLGRYGGLALVDQMRDMAWDAAYWARGA